MQKKKNISVFFIIFSFVLLLTSVIVLYIKAVESINSSSGSMKNYQSEQNDPEYNFFAYLISHYSSLVQITT